MSRISKKQAKVELMGKRCYIGVDVHKATYYVAILTEDGLRKEFSTPAAPDKLINQLLVDMQLDVLGLAHESGPTGYALAWACQEAGIPVVVAASTKIPRPVVAGGKTDRLDCIKLADFLARGMLKGIAIPTREEHGLRELERRRQQLVKSRRIVRQNIKSFLLKNGISEPHGLQSWGKGGIEALRALALSGHLRIALDSCLEEHDFLLRQLAQVRSGLTAALAEQGKMQTVAHLRTVPGVGETVAQTFVAEIFRPERFKRPEEISAYVGLAPITSHSGSGRETARLHKAGYTYLRSILVEAAWHLIGKEATFKALYSRVLGRTALPQKAIIAVARKLLLVLWRIAVENRPYRSVNM